MEVKNPPAKGGTSFNFPVQVFVPVLRSQLDDGVSKEDLKVEWLWPKFPKLGMMDSGTGAGGGRWKGIEGEGEEMAFHTSRGFSCHQDKPLLGSWTEILLQTGNVTWPRGRAWTSSLLCPHQHWPCADVHWKQQGHSPTKTKSPSPNTSVEESTDPTPFNLGKGPDSIIRISDKNKIFFI